MMSSIAIEHVAKRLPFGLNILTPKHIIKYNERSCLEMKGLSLQVDGKWQYECRTEDNDLLFFDFSPKTTLILHPWIDLKKRITHRGKSFLPIVELAKLEGFIFNSYTIAVEYETIVLYSEWIDSGSSPNVKRRSFFEIDKDLSIDKGIEICTQRANRKATFDSTVTFNTLANNNLLISKLYEWHFRQDEPDGTWIDVNKLTINPYA